MTFSRVFVTSDLRRPKKMTVPVQLKKFFNKTPSDNVVARTFPQATTTKYPVSSPQLW